MNTGELPPGPYTPHGRPFATSTDPKVLWPGKTYQDAMAILKEGVLQNAGLLLLTGDPGSGKTLVTNALLDSLGDRAVAAKITYPSLPPADFYRSIGTAYAIEGEHGARASFLQAFSSFLDAAAAKDQRVLLIIDDVQSLTPELFEELPHLVDPEPAGKPRANILLVGPKDFKTLLGRDHPHVAERIRILCSLSPLSERETEEYIRHHLLLSGSEADLFSPAALHAVFCSAAGTPGSINILCDLALRRGHAQGTRSIGEEIVSECANALGLLTGEVGSLLPAALPAPGRGTEERRDARDAEPQARPERLGQRAPWRTVALQAAAALLLIGVGGVLGAYFASLGRDGRGPVDTLNPEGRAVSREEKPLAALTPYGGSTPERDPQPAGQTPATLPGAKTPARAAIIGVGPERPPQRAEASRTPVQRDEDADLRLPDPTRRAAHAESAPEDPESPDPAAVIDWILNQQPPPNR